VAAGQGAFRDVEEAVSGLYAAASKAKRSKIRSCAHVHEELGDLLAYPTELGEKAGLRLASAIRDGLAGRLRAALGSGMGTSPAEEWDVLEPVVEEHEAESLPESKRGGRPRKAPPRRSREGQIALANGISMERIREDDGYAIKFRGPVDIDMMDAVMLEIKRLLEPI
jgi:ParB family chromosome partitioning protein